MYARVLGISVLVLLLFPPGASPAPAQLAAGDLAVACLPPAQGLYRVTPTGTVETVLGAAYTFPNALTMADDNTDLVVAMADPGTSYVRNPLYRVGPDGRVTTLALIQPGPPNAVDLSEHGNWLVFTAAQNAVLEVDAGSARMTSLVQLPAGSLNAGQLDLEDGGLWLGAYWQLPQGGVLKAAPDGSVRTVAWGIGRVSGIAVDPVRRDVVVTRFDAPQVLRVNPNGQTKGLVAFQGANAVAVAADGTLWLAAGQTLLHATADGVPIRSFRLPGPAAALEIYGRRLLVGRGPATPASDYTVRVHSHRPTDSGQDYRLVASTAPGPALPIGDGRLLAVGASPLLWLSLLDAVPFFRGFSGRLDPFGRATATIRIPPGLGGLRLYITGVVIDRRVRRVSTVMNPIGITLE